MGALAPKEKPKGEDMLADISSAVQQLNMTVSELAQEVQGLKQQVASMNVVMNRMYELVYSLNYLKPAQDFFETVQNAYKNMLDYIHNGQFGALQFNSGQYFGDLSQHSSYFEPTKVEIYLKRYGGGEPLTSNGQFNARAALAFQSLLLARMGWFFIQSTFTELNTDDNMLPYALSLDGHLHSYQAMLPQLGLQSWVQQDSTLLRSLSEHRSCGDYTACGNSGLGSVKRDNATWVPGNSIAACCQQAQACEKTVVLGQDPQTVEISDSDRAQMGLRCWGAGEMLGETWKEKVLASVPIRPKAAVAISLSGPGLSRVQLELRKGGSCPGESLAMCTSLGVGRAQYTLASMNTGGASTTAYLVIQGPLLQGDMAMQVQSEVFSCPSALRGKAGLASEVVFAAVGDDWSGRSAYVALFSYPGNSKLIVTLYLWYCHSVNQWVVTSASDRHASRCPDADGSVRGAGSEHCPIDPISSPWTKLVPDQWMGVTYGHSWKQLSGAGLRGKCVDDTRGHRGAGGMTCHHIAHSAAAHFEAQPLSGPTWNYDWSQWDLGEFRATQMCCVAGGGRSV
jgi:hypothetical protein